MDPNEVVNEALKEVAKKAAAEAWAGKSRLLPARARVRDFFRSRPSPGPAAATDEPATPRGILILGPGGTGKTTLARVLSGDVNVLIDPPGYYEPSLLVEAVPLLGAAEIELVVVPGQGYRLDQKFTTLSANLIGGAYRGVVLVVDCGHHAVEVEWSKDHALRQGRRKPEFLAALHAAHLREEFTLLDRLAPSLKAITRRTWVLVVVLKQDLWCREQDAVVRHYRDGEWGVKVGEIADGVDPMLLFWHTTYASLHIQNYTTLGGRETLRKNAAGYDAVRQRQSLEELFRAFDALRGWEERE
jgi:hypothetical protein